MFAGQLGCEAVNFVLKRLIKEERPSRIHRTGKGYGMPSSHAQFVVFWAVAMVLFLLVRHAPSWSGHGYGPRGRGRNAATTAVAGGGNGNGNGDVNGVTHNGGGRNNRAGAPPPPPPVRPRRGIWDRDWVALESYAHRPWSLAERAAASALVLSVAAAVAWSRVYLGYHTVTQVLAGCLAGALSALAWYGATHVAREAGLLARALESPVARSLRVRDLVVSEDLCQAGWEKWEERRVAAAVQSERKDKVR